MKGLLARFSFFGTLFKSGLTLTHLFFFFFATVSDLSLYLFLDTNLQLIAFRKLSLALIDPDMKVTESEVGPMNELIHVLFNI